jgi:bacillithiol system protein YtxJ
MPLLSLSSLTQLDELLAGSGPRPFYLFKHSETCGMSLQAYEEVREAVDDSEFDTPVYLVSVQASRPVSQAIAARLRVVHQSPQILLVQDGTVRWHTSHMAITAAALRDAIDRHSLATT